MKQTSNEQLRWNRVAARSRLALLFVFLAFFPFAFPTSHSRAQVAVGEQALAFNTGVVASASLAGAAQAAASLPLRASVADQSGMFFNPSSWILVGLTMMLCAYIGSRRMKRDSDGDLH